MIWPCVCVDDDFGGHFVCVCVRGGGGAAACVTQEFPPLFWDHVTLPDQSPARYLNEAIVSVQSVWRRVEGGRYYSTLLLLLHISVSPYHSLVSFSLYIYIYLSAAYISIYM